MAALQIILTKTISYLKGNFSPIGAFLTKLKIPLSIVPEKSYYGVFEISSQKERSSFIGSRQIKCSSVCSKQLIQTTLN